MKKEKRNIDPKYLILNDGSVDWLPANPRTWTQLDIDRTSRSIAQDPDFLEDRPILAFAEDDMPQFMVFAGNLRTTAAKGLALKSVPVVVYYPETDADREAVKRRAMKDNGTFGSWDYDALANEWDDLPLAEFGVPVWDADKALANGLSTEGKEGGEGYDEFVDKFKQKLTTDDCYTPPAVYDAVRDFVDKRVTSLAGKKIVRPFYPNGDFEKENYPEGCVVIDNPPFSILSKIIRFYCGRDIPFFLFAPALTLFSASDCDLTYIVTYSDIIYENGANIGTGFITNMIPDTRIWLCPELQNMIEEAQAEPDKTKQQFVYPDNIVTAAILRKIVTRGIEWKVPKVACEYINDSDSCKEQGRSLFGGGFLLAERAAAERAAAERAAAERAAAERAAATKLNLSDREREIIKRLSEQYPFEDE